MRIKLDILESRRNEMSDVKTLLKALGIALIVFLFFGCGHEPVPPELIGTWTTSAPGYKRASMEITAETITFRDGRGYAGVNRITDLGKQADRNGTLFWIGYRGEEGGEFVLNFYLKKIKQGKTEHHIIVYKNQKNLEWTKEAG
jgi:hypothetical protein